MRLSASIFLGLFLLVGCAEDEASSTSDDLTSQTEGSEESTDTSTTVENDATTRVPEESGGGAQEEDSTGDNTEDISTGSDSDAANTTDGEGLEDELSCEGFCEELGACAEWTEQRCVAECKTARSLECDAGCFDTPTTCQDALDCLGLPPSSRSFSQGPYGTNFRDIAGPVIIPTTNGDWSFETYFDGNDSYIFLNTTANSGDFSNYVNQLWASNFKFFLWEAPTNVHVFFMTFDQSQEAVAAMEEQVMTSLSKMDDAEQCWWKKRVHFVTQPSQTIIGWIGELLGKNGWAAFAVDRQQQIRAVGLLQTVGGTPQLSFLAYEAQHYNFEAEREAILAAEDAFIFDVVKDENIKNEVIDINLPGPEEMSKYNRMEVDLGNYCTDNLESNCGEWDYMSYLFACEIPVEKENAYAEEECQPKVNPVEAVEEQDGLCPDQETPCSPENPCANDFECLGYIAPVEEVVGIDADTKPCECTGLMGEALSSQHTCNGEGTGYGTCACACNTEITRWITTYGREGRWVTDITPFMAYFKRGGPVRLRTEWGNPYVTDLSLRFMSDEDTPVSSEIIPLFTGGGYNEAYNDKYAPVELNIPASAKKVEVVAFITGHGFGKDQENCAEFCNHEHIFSVNGEQYFHDNPFVGDNFGCAKQVPDGTVPNQYGTWYLGRGGWCPGMDAKPVRFDVTSALKPGESATFEYKSLFEGDTYIPTPFDWGSGGFGAMIRLTSYVVIYE